MIPIAHCEVETLARSVVSYKYGKDRRGPEIAVGGFFLSLDNDDFMQKKTLSFAGLVT